MPRSADIKKVAVIGSGPIVIGQAAEFDYAGTQACKVLREEGIEVVLVNSNPATIMTDMAMADKVYLEPLRADVVAEILKRERPDSILPTLGGQTGLNVAMELEESGVLKELGIRLLGTSAESIRSSEDREAFKNKMQEINEPVAPSTIAHTVEECISFARRQGYPLIVRPAYTLGGTGGGFAYNEQELIQIAHDGLRASRTTQVLLEKSLLGWKEIEFEVIRDSHNNCITVCNMENFDPVGVHTGDSIVIAPSQTLRDNEYQMLRRASLRIISALGIEGGCNVQYALDPDTAQYYVIEVNPRVSRSSALASKATGYPIAKVSTRIAIGYTLDEIENGVTGKTKACFEPALDYVVVKIPRWPFDKFVTADKNIGTKMKATGEVMALGLNFESALNKAVRSLEMGYWSLDRDFKDMSDVEIVSRLSDQNTERLFVVAEASRRGMPVEEIHRITGIDPWFLSKIRNLVALEETIKGKSFKEWTRELMMEAKRNGISDKAISQWQGVPEMEVRKLRKSLNVIPSYRMVDTCAAEFDAVSAYYYSCYGVENEVSPDSRKAVVVLGSGPIRIGQGVEFDYCSVHCVWALQKAGFETVIINSNPETVSTDFDTSDRLYFEPLTPEDVLNILELEDPYGVMAQFGGQTAIKLAEPIADDGYDIVGTSVESINGAEDRKTFDELLGKLGIERPSGTTVFGTEEAVRAAAQIGYPVLVRPSYVLGGQGMVVAYDEDSVREYMSIINMNEQEYPILIDKYIAGKELEIDAICDGDDILIPSVMEHVEASGIHSGDSICMYPVQSIGAEVCEKIYEISKALAQSLDIKGLMNIQFIYSGGEIYVIEVNPRSSRTIPYISKITGLPVVELAARAALGEKLSDMGYGTGIYKTPDVVCVKMPVFSFEKLPEVEVGLGPEMKSTGEVLGIGRTLDEALKKSFMACNISLEPCGALFSIDSRRRDEAAEIAKSLEDRGFKLYATPETGEYMREKGIHVEILSRMNESTQIEDMLENGDIKLVINTPTHGRIHGSNGFRLRRKAVECAAVCVTSLDTARALLRSMNAKSCVPVGLHDIRH